MRTRRYIVLLCLLPFVLSADLYEFEFTPLWRAEFRGVSPADLDGDGRDELIMSRKNDNEELWGISITDINNYVRWQYWSSNGIQARGVVDIDGDGGLEIVVSEKVADSAFLLIFSQEGKIIKRIKVLEGKDIDDSGGWDGNVGFRQGLNVDDDSTQELLLTAGTSFDLQPRGVLVYDPDTDEILWHYWTGFYPNDIRVADLDGDGDVEIVIGAFSCWNGGEANGTDDSHTYVVALDHLGQRLWFKQIGGRFSGARVMVADFNSDGRMEIVVSEETHLEGYIGPDRLMLLDGVSGKILNSIEVGRTYRGRILCDLNGDSVSEIIVGNSDGVVRAFDGDLRVISEFEYGGEISISDAGDLDGDGRPEIIAADLVGNMLILNHRLNPVGIFKASKGYQIDGFVAYDREKRKILMQISQASGRLEYVLFDLRKILSSQAKRFLAYAPLVLILLVSSGFILPIFLRRSILFRRSLNKSSHGIILLSRKGKVRVTNDAARDVLGLRKKARLSRPFKTLDIDPQLEEVKKILSDSIRLEEPRRVTLTKEENGQERRIEIQTFKAGAQVWLVSLADITEQEFGRRVATLMPVAQQLAHGIKNPLNHIRLAIQRLNKFILAGRQKQKEATRYSGMVAEEAERLIKLTDGFMRFTKLNPPQLKPTSIRDLIEAVVDRFSQILPKNLEIKVDSEERLPKLMIDADQISVVIDHLVDNAISAMGKKGLITIEVRSVCIKGKTDSIKISIKDTGCGIPDKYRDKIFEPYFSLKEGGTGLGLPMVKKIIQDHEGSISMETSQGQGTTFTISLPVQKDDE